MYIIVDLNYIQAAAEIDKNWRSVSRTYRFMIVDFTYFRDGKLEEDVEKTRGCSFINFNFTTYLSAGFNILLCGGTSFL